MNSCMIQHHHHMIGTFIADLVLQILSWMAKEERERVRKRQRGGIDLALQKGIVFGQPKVNVTEEFKEVYDRWKAGEVTAVKVMGELGVKKTTFYNLQLSLSFCTRTLQAAHPARDRMPDLSLTTRYVD